MASARYIYDAFNQQVFIKEISTYDKTTFYFDGLASYKERIMYLINEQNRTCIKQPLKGHFQPIEVPQDATLLGAAVLGSSSAPLEGLEVSSWIGETEKVKYMITVTMFGCIPVSTVYLTPENGWATISFFDNVIGVVNPEELYPLSFCQGVKPRDEPSDFYSLFRKH